MTSGATRAQTERRGVSLREVSGVTLSVPETEDGQDKRRIWGASPWRGEGRRALEQGPVHDE